MNNCQIIYLIMHSCFFKDFSQNSIFGHLSHMYSTANRIQIIFFFIGRKKNTVILNDYRSSTISKPITLFCKSTIIHYLLPLHLLSKLLFIFYFHAILKSYCLFRSCKRAECCYRILDI